MSDDAGGDDATAPDPAEDGDERRERVRGSLLGLACGDALARPVDGEPAAAVRARHGRVTEMLGADGRRAGSTTAVAAAALDAAAGLLDGDRSGGGRGDDGAAAGEPTPAGAGGALARAVPFGLVRGTPGRRATATATPRSDGGQWESCGADGGTGDAADAATVEARVALAVVVGELVDGAPVDDALGTARTVAVDRGAPVGVREALSVVGDPAAVSLDGADAVGAFEAGLHEAVAAVGPEGAVVSAASRGGAACARAAVAGAVAGARHGVDAVPVRWRNELRGGDELVAVADGLAAVELDR